MVKPLKKIYNRIQRWRYRFVTVDKDIPELNFRVLRNGKWVQGDKKSLCQRALLYYKTDPFWDKSCFMKHTNNWEIVEMCKILNTKFFIVDVIDRNVKNFTPKNIYDLFIGLGSGNSGKYFAKYAKVLTKAKKVLYATGADPYLSNELTMERYDDFYKRTGIKALPMRIRNIDFNKFAQLADCFFVINGAHSIKSYEKYDKSIYPISVSTFA